MAAYYNEFDPFAAQWLRNLITAGHIAAGEVDERSIVEVKADDIRGFKQCHFFAGIGAWSHALRSAGWSDDRFVWTGSCPCQPLSRAGRQEGGEDARHLWPVWLNLIRECCPPILFGEQVADAPGLAWLDLVWADLEEASYAVAAADLCAAGVGAPHIRQRMYWVANAYGSGQRQQPSAWVHDNGTAGNDTDGCGPIVRDFWGSADWIDGSDGKRRPVEPGTFPLADGPSCRVGRLRAYGNAIVAPVAAEFIGSLMDFLP